MIRRSFLAMLVSGVSLLVAGVVGIPALITGLSPALQPRRGERWRPVGRVADFPIGEVCEGAILVSRTDWPRLLPRQAVYVWRRSQDELIVFSRNCTDLGCPLHYDRGSTCFFCPCHGGIFKQDGERLAGPPNRPMDRYVHRVRDGVVEIDTSSIPPAA